MRMLIPISVAGLVAFALAIHPTPVQASDLTYVGVKSCALCHRHKDQGDQFAVWQKSKHAHAYEVLGTDKAKAAAKKLGVTGDPQKQDACLICHTTGHGLAKSRFSPMFHATDGVQCEACHGPGQRYRMKTTMKKIWEEMGGDSSKPSATAKRVGLIMPTAKDCETCHQKTRTVDGKTYTNPFYKPFNFDEMRKKIAHPVPKK